MYKNTTPKALNEMDTALRSTAAFTNHHLARGRRRRRRRRRRTAPPPPRLKNGFFGAKSLSSSSSKHNPPKVEASSSSSGKDDFEDDDEVVGVVFENEGQTTTTTTTTTTTRTRRSVAVAFGACLSSSSAFFSAAAAFFGTQDAGVVEAAEFNEGGGGGGQQQQQQQQQQQRKDFDDECENCSNSNTSLREGDKKFATSPSGLRYIDLREGDGTKVPKRGDVVVVDWVGYTAGYQAKKIESTRETDAPFTFTVGSGEAIPAFDEAVLTMGKGGVKRIEIAGELEETLGYSRNPKERYDGVGPKPTTFGGLRALDFVLDNKTLKDFNRTLLFDVKLVSIRNSS